MQVPVLCRRSLSGLGAGSAHGVSESVSESSGFDDGSVHLIMSTSVVSLCST